MVTRRCCCPCLIASDNFDRADGPVSDGGEWYGGGEIVSNILEASNDHTTVCHPAKAPLGALWAVMTVVGDTALSHVVRLGDPTGDYEVWIEFGGTVGIGTGTLTITVKNGIDPDESYEYDWENANEEIYICYAPGTQMSAGPSSRTQTAPQWVTLCIPEEPSDNCWLVGGTTDVGNWMFVSGKYVDWQMELHWVEQNNCEDCDCYCWDNGVQSCIPKEITATLTGCVSTSVTMRQKFITTTSSLDPPTSIDWTQKFEWVSDPISCSGATQEEYGFVLILRCMKSDGDTYPRMRLEMMRYGTIASGGCSTFGFDLDDPDTIDTEHTISQLTSYAYSKSTSTCDPLYLEFPDLVEDNWACNDASPTCCGGYVVSGGDIMPPEYIGVTITE